jgi:OOP family OmpA-OmpF porin
MNFTQPLAAVALVATAFMSMPACGAPAAAPSAPNQIVVTGSVPDEATRASIVGRLRDLYGAHRVVDQLSVEPVVAPPNWGTLVPKLLTPALGQVSRGQLSVRGQDVELRGEVAQEAQRQQIAADAAAALNPTYTVTNLLRVSAAEQNLLDAALANRIVEFEPGSSVLRPQGVAILDEMAAVLTKVQGKKVEIIGHTDAQGSRAANLALSQARADTVRNYLVTRKGVNPGVLSSSGAGPDRPVAANDTPEGRARNRRIEFRVGQ